MSKIIPGNQKHLTLDDRIYIQESLDEGKSFKEIARYLCKDPSTISKEVRLHRVKNPYKGSFNNPYNFCIHRFHCKRKNACEKIQYCDKLCRSCHFCNKVCKRFEPECCNRIDSAPYVCNGCDKKRSQCTIENKYDYDAKMAQMGYEEKLKASREGINMTKHELHEMNNLVQPLIAQGQTPYMIITNHPELGITVKTLYNYIHQGVLLVRDVDLKRKVKFKPRKCHKTQIKNREVFIGRTYDDFKALNLGPDEFYEMDTVKSARGSNKCILTMFFPDTGLLIAHLMNRCTPGAVKLVYEQLEKSLGGTSEFNSICPICLTDRGSEFGDPDSLEANADGEVRTHIYYCDPMRSNQKGGIEEVHTVLRQIIPKKTVFTDLTQWKVRKAVNNINSMPRENKDGKTPYELAEKKWGPEIIRALKLKRIAPDDVNLTPQLLK